MRADLFTLWASLSVVGALTIHRRDPQIDDNDLGGTLDDNDNDNQTTWRPKTKDPHFFNLQVDDQCQRYTDPPEDPSYCKFDGYGIRLEKGIVIATPYNNRYDPKLPTFFVDDDTQIYTVSRDPLQLYVDSVTGAMKYNKVGWLPPSAIGTSFYHTGNNPLQLIDPSPSYLTWPSTHGIAYNGEWAFCPLGETGQYQVFVNNQNFDPQGVAKDYCSYYQLAALNADPWKSSDDDDNQDDDNTQDDDTQDDDTQDDDMQDDGQH